MNEQDVLKSALAQLFALFAKLESQKNESISEGARCAIDCASDSLKDRIEYLNEFNEDTPTEQLIEFKSEIESLIIVLESDIEDAGESQIDVDFKNTMSEILKEVYSIQNKLS